MPDSLHHSYLLFDNVDLIYVLHRDILIHYHLRHGEITSGSFF